MDTLSAYGGSASDRQIVESSTLAEVVDHIDPIMTDKGFEIIYVCFMLKPTIEMALF